MAETPRLIDYQAALSGVVFYPVPRAGYLRLQGSDRLAFLQRQTTNDVTLLASSHSVLTVLTNPAARILDVLRLVHETDKMTGLITLPGKAGETTRFFTSRIFFKDQVSLVDASHEIAQIDLGGPLAEELLASLGFSDLPNPEAVAFSELDEIKMQVIGQSGFASVGYRMLIPSEKRENLEAILSRMEAVQLSESSHQTLRVENGLPAVEAELTGDFTPLEVGLETAISTKKGCYTGQEVIARQLNYDKVTQHLVVLHLQAPGASGERAWSNGKPAGMLTTATLSPRFGLLALAVIKRPFHQPGTSVIIGGDGKSGGTPAIVAELPLTLPV